MSAPETAADVNAGKSVKQSKTTPNYYKNIMNVIKKINSNSSDRFDIGGFNFDNETPAYITIAPNMKNSNELKIGAFSSIKTEFMLNTFEEQRKEKFQAFETFGNPSVFFFGEKLRYYAFSGYLVDSEYQKITKNNKRGKSWANSFKNYWDNNFRGSKLIENGEIAIVVFNKNVIWGYPISLSINNNAQAPFLAGFSFNMLISKHKVNESISSNLKITDLMGKDTKLKFNKFIADLKTTQNQINTYYEKNINEELTAEDNKNLSELKKNSEELYNKIMVIIRSIVKFSGI